MLKGYEPSYYLFIFGFLTFFYKLGKKYHDAKQLPV